MRPLQRKNPQPLKPLKPLQQRSMGVLVVVQLAAGVAVGGRMQSRTERSEFGGLGGSLWRNAQDYVTRLQLCNGRPWLRCDDAGLCRWPGVGA